MAENLLIQLDLDPRALQKSHHYVKRTIEQFSQEWSDDVDVGVGFE